MTPEDFTTIMAPHHCTLRIIQLCRKRGTSDPRHVFAKRADGTRVAIGRWIDLNELSYAQVVDKIAEKLAEGEQLA